MVLKTFNVDSEIHKRFSTYCKDHGISMSKQIETFMRAQMEEDPELRKEHKEKLDRMSKTAEKKQNEGFEII